MTKVVRTRWWHLRNVRSSVVFLSESHVITEYCLNTINWVYIFFTLCGRLYLYAFCSPTCVRRHAKVFGQRGTGLRTFGRYSVALLYNGTRTRTHRGVLSPRPISDDTRVNPDDYALYTPPAVSLRPQLLAWRGNRGVTIMGASCRLVRWIRSLNMGTRLDVRLLDGCEQPLDKLCLYVAGKRSRGVDQLIAEYVTWPSHFRWLANWRWKSLLLHFVAVSNFQMYQDKNGSGGLGADDGVPFSGLQFNCK